MRILLPINLQKTGGTSTFARKFKAGMETHGHQVVLHDPNYKLKIINYDALLVSPRAPWPLLRAAKRANIPIIHRLDGVYYPATIAGRKYPIYNLPLRVIRNRLADAIIYQSQYSKKQCDHFLGRLSPKTYPPKPKIIYNGVDTDHFSPSGHAVNLRDNPDQHVFITASRFRRADQIEPLLEAFRVYRSTYEQNSKLVIIGPFDHYPPPNSTRQVELVGPVDNKKLPAYLRAADVFLFSHQNPPCPNNIIEAMACGLPICGVADGAMPELTKPGINSQLIPVNDEGFKNFRKIDPAAMATNLHTIMNTRDQYAIASHQAAVQRFSLSTMIHQYLKVFEHVHQT